MSRERGGGQSFWAYNQENFIISAAQQNPGMDKQTKWVIEPMSVFPTPLPSRLKAKASKDKVCRGGEAGGGGEFGGEWGLLPYPCRSYLDRINPKATSLVETNCYVQDRKAIFSKILLGKGQKS